MLTTLPPALLEAPAATAAATATAPHRLRAGPDTLAGATLRDLTSPLLDAPAPPGVLTSLLVALPTFGLLPALWWPRQFAQHVAAERRQFQALSAWVVANSDLPDDGRLARAAGALRFRPILYLLAGACGAFAVLRVALAPAFVAGGFDGLLACTYLVQGAAASPAGPWRERLFVTWVASLAAAYLLHWLQVNLHAARVRRFLDAFNRHAIHHALSPVFLRPIAFGFRPLWLLGAVLLCVVSAPWGILLMLAGATHARYARAASPEVRALLAERLRDMLLLQRDPIQVPAAAAAATSADRRARCGTPGCRRPLPAGATFCPRCGARAAQAVDRVA